MATVEADTRADAVVDILGALYYGELSADDFMLFPSGAGDGDAEGDADADADGDDDGGVSIAFEDESDIYWQRSYGGQDGFTCLARTVLSQNTSDKASQPAFDALLERYGEGDLAASLAGADRDALADTIRPAGLYNQKSATLISLAERVVEEYGDADAFDEFVTDGDPDEVRDRLLSMTGVGPKTADCVLLFSGGRDGVFPVDTHVHRIYRRLGIAPPDADHEEVREVLEREVTPQKCGFGHTASIQFGRDYCTAREPACLEGPAACPLAELCDRVGVSPETGQVVDPAAAAE